MSKKISFAPKPTLVSTTAEEGDKWVDHRNAPPPPLPENTPEKKMKLKRLTLDIPEDLHQAIKIGCAKRKTKMIEEITKILQDHYVE